MHRNTAFLLLLLAGFFSCSNANDPTRVLTSTTNAKARIENTNEVYKTDTSDLLKNFMTWYRYTYHNIRLSQDFIAEDQNSNRINRSTFLQQLTTGDFVALKIAKKNNVAVYKLWKQQDLQSDMKRTMIQMAQTAIALENMEGKGVPAYHFTDLEGNTYTNENTKGSVILMKCWFIHCVACVEEFPELNRLADRYQNRNDVQFISLAIDQKADLTAFLKKKPFHYKVVPGMGKYMSEALHVNAYPLHLLINKEGTVMKASNALEDILPYFEKEVR
jgi:cytochrome oxidase Cu insertion factor (SCO1/SenC/PrrC family)